LAVRRAEFIRYTRRFDPSSAYIKIAKPRVSAASGKFSVDNVALVPLISTTISPASSRTEHLIK
jgi:hypothetical protein